MKLRTVTYNTLLACALVSCGNSAEERLSSEGYIDLKVTMDASVDDVAVTKSAADMSEIAVSIVSSEGETVYQCEDISSVEAPVKVRTGDYLVYATSGADGGAAAFDTPFYTGSASIQVRSFTVSQAKIVCELAGVMTTVSFSQDIKDNFTYSLLIDNGIGTLVYDSSNEDKEGYFSATGQLNWVLNLENAKGEKFVVKDSYADVMPKQHYAFDFSLESVEDAPFGAAEFKIILDDSLNETYHIPTIWINEDGPSIAGMDSHEIYVSDMPSDIRYEVHSTRQYNRVIVSHSDARLIDYGLPYSSDLVQVGVLSAFVAESGVGVKVSDENGQELSEISAEARDIDFDFTSLLSRLPVGHYSINISVENQSGLVTEKKIEFIVNSCVNLLDCAPWAKFMFVKGGWLSDSQPSGLRVQYKLSSESDWHDFVPGVSTQLVVNQETKTFKAYICGLTPSSDYQVRIMTSDEVSSVVSCMTEGVKQLYNSNFDHWYQSGAVWYPYEQNAAETVWDSANKGVTSITDSNTVPASTEGECISEKAVKMTTIYVEMVGITKLAAGNIYTGKFNGLVGTSGANLNWGYGPGSGFESRPLGFKGYYRYDAKTINRTGSGYDSYSGQPDLCQIQIVLSDAGTHYTVIPTTYNGVDVNGPTLNGEYCDLSTHWSVVARGIKNYGDTGGQFKEVTLPFIYRSITRIPSHIVVTFTSSYLGDYFTGGEGSVMWADEFELVYDPIDLPADDRDAFFALFD